MPTFFDSKPPSTPPSCFALCSLLALISPSCAEVDASAHGPDAAACDNRSTSTLRSSRRSGNTLADSIIDDDDKPEPEPEDEPSVEPEPELADVQLSYAIDIQPLFIDACVDACHSPGGLGGPGGPFPDAQLDLSKDDGYAELLDGDSQQVDMPLIGEDADGSYLWHKLNGTQESVGGSGVVMPFAADPLSEDELDLVFGWIEGGALP